MAAMIRVFLYVNLLVDYNDVMGHMISLTFPPLAILLRLSTSDQCPHCPSLIPIDSLVPVLLTTGVCDGVVGGGDGSGDVDD